MRLTSIYGIWQHQFITWANVDWSFTWEKIHIFDISLKIAKINSRLQRNHTHYGGPVNSPRKWPVTRKMFPFDDVIMGNSDQGRLSPTGRMYAKALCLFQIRTVNLPCLTSQFNNRVYNCLVHVNVYLAKREYVLLFLHVLALKGTYFLNLTWQGIKAWMILTIAKPSWIIFMHDICLLDTSSERERILNNW